MSACAECNLHELPDGRAFRIYCWRCDRVLMNVMPIETIVGLRLDARARIRETMEFLLDRTGCTHKKDRVFTEQLWTSPV